MKKIVTLAVLFTATLMSFTACDNNKENGGKEPTPDPEPEYVSKITVDGVFTDWNDVKPAVATLPDGAEKVALKTLKVYADEFNIDFYMELDKTNVYPVSMYINVDNDVNTGSSYRWNSGADILLQNKLYSWSDDKTTQLDPVAWDPTVYGWDGTDATEDGSWDTTILVADGSGVCTTCLPVVVDGEIVAIEGQIVRELIPVSFADTFGIGVVIAKRSWSSIGALPQVVEGDVAMLNVTIQK